MNLPLVTVVMPIYNVENYVEESVKSICNQTYNFIELIIVNDGGTDNSINIVYSRDKDMLQCLQFSNSYQYYRLHSLSSEVHGHDNKN